MLRMWIKGKNQIDEKLFVKWENWVLIVKCWENM